MPKSKVALLKCSGYPEPEVKKAISNGLELLGGINKFVKKNEKILLKPNFLASDSPEKCVTTHPVIFKVLAEMLIENGVKVSYGDSPGFGRILATAKKAGFHEHAVKLKVELADFENGKEVFVENARQNKKFFISKGVLNSDGIISLPKLKTHGFERFTGCIKNQFGCIPGLRKAEFHVKLPDAYDFAKMLVDLNNFINPRLYIMDGIMAMEGNGPRGGKPKQMLCILISSDPVALDATACRLINLNPELVPTNVFGMESGAGTYLKEEIEILGDDFDEIYCPNFDIDRSEIKPFKKNNVFNFFSNALVSKPVINPRKCIKCGECIAVCPVKPKALSWKKNDKTIPPVYDYSKCIRCFCCQELCPEEAISLKKPLLSRMIIK